MEYLTPNFTKDMLQDYTVLVPNMCPIQFRLVKAAMESEGYHKVELLGSASSEVTQNGLRYVHNDQQRFMNQWNTIDRRAKRDNAGVL